MAGVVLALASLPGCQPEHVEPGLRYLIARCDDPALPGMRVTADAAIPVTGGASGDSTTDWLTECRAYSPR
jgi:hypothetical protein